MAETILVDRITALEIAVAKNSERIQAAKDHLETLKVEREKQQAARYAADAAALVALSEKVDRQFEAQKVALDLAMQAADRIFKTTLEASDRAISKAEVSAERRFEGVNEFRAQLNDQQQTFARRGEVDVRFGALDERLSAMNSQIIQSKGKGEGLNAAWIYATGAIAAVIAIASVVLNFMK